MPKFALARCRIVLLERNVMTPIPRTRYVHGSPTLSWRAAGCRTSPKARWCQSRDEGSARQESSLAIVISFLRQRWFVRHRGDSRTWFSANSRVIVGADRRPFRGQSRVMRHRRYTRAMFSARRRICGGRFIFVRHEIHLRFIVTHERRLPSDAEVFQV